MIKTGKTYDTKDVSNIDPIETEGMLSRWVKVFFVNEYTRYEWFYGYWHAVDKCWYDTGGKKDINDLVRYEEI